MTTGQQRRLKSELERVDIAVVSALRAGIQAKAMRECDVALAIGMNAATFSRSINRLRPFTIEEVGRVSEVIGLDPFEVMFGGREVDLRGEAS